MIKAIALDDEPPALDVIESFCNLTDYIDLVKTFTRDGEAMKYLTNFPVDLLFLDINMPSISGLDFKKQVEAKTMVIFTTAYSEFALEGFNLNAVDYLLKPFTFERFLQAAEKAKMQYQFLHQNALVKPEYISIRVGYSLVKLALANIVFIEGLDDYLKIHLKGQKPVVSRMTMKAILEKLPQSDFVRVHRSYIVPLAKIESVRNRVIFLRDNNEEEIPLGTRYESKFYEVFGK
jgi:two-component system, LytTR family, response regulator